MSRKSTTREASNNDDKSLTHWRSELENEKLFGHLEGSYRTAVNAIFSNDQNTTHDGNTAPECSSAKRVKGLCARNCTVVTGHKVLVAKNSL